ncbi:MAG: N-acetyl sugar amidotransferase [Candidatus Methanofastidiosum sp.]|nr:N-acetyl sugar amidotransferase [Methanofastidiosum sp.]
MITKERPYQICTRCVMDTTDPEIVFDKNGVCNHCKRAELLMNMPPYSLSPDEKKKSLEKLAEEIKEKGKGKKYDCVIGLSGGTDSTYAAYIVVKLGLRPLAVHLDNGWNSELSVKNIENIVKNLGIDLYTYVIDWDEFKDLQMAFLKASTPDSEIPTDHAICSALYQVARKHNVKYILAGTNLGTESILPALWSHGHSDWKYIKNIQKRFGSKKLKTFPHQSMLDLFIDVKIRKIKWVHLLNYIDYVKKDAVNIIEKELDWRNYGGKHYESIYTRFFQGYILPVKFNFDKRRAHLSSLIISNQITRDYALQELTKDPYPSIELLEEDKEFFINKFGIEEDQFNQIMNAKTKTFWDYPSYEKSSFWAYIKNLYYKIYKKK